MITVIIPTYNRLATLERAICSVVAQTRAPKEIIVVDDGSTDDTREFIPKQFPDIRYIHQENKGVSAARNRGISESAGNWIAFLDSDDEWLPPKLERQLEALEASPEDCVCHTDEIWIRRGRRVNPMQKHAKAGGEIFKKCLPLCAISPSSVIIAKTVFDEVGLFDESLPVCEDYDLWLRICATLPVLYVDEKLIVKYGGHDDQLSRRYHSMDLYRIRALEKSIQSGKLTPEHRKAAVDMLIEKIDIYTQGARKRGKLEEVEAYERKRDMFA